MPQCSVYRCYAKNKKLLYVGISVNPLGRLRNHKTTSPWITECIKVTIHWHADRLLAHYYEIMAIQEEKPKYNIAHTPRPKHRRTPRKLPPGPLTAIGEAYYDEMAQRGPGSTY